MKTAHLFRGNSTDEGTFGYLVVEGLYWHSLELPSRNNKPNISCIPQGEYDVIKRYSPHFKKELYWVQNVVNRSFILIHSANFAGDVSKGFQSHLQGCIALGKAKGRFKNKFGKNQNALLSSRKAIKEFTEYMNNESFKLIIKDIS